MLLQPVPHFCCFYLPCVLSSQGPTFGTIRIIGWTNLFNICLSVMSFVVYIVCKFFNDRLTIARISSISAILSSVFNIYVLRYIKVHNWHCFICCISCLLLVTLSTIIILIFLWLISNPLLRLSIFSLIIRSSSYLLFANRTGSSHSWDYWFVYRLGLSLHPKRLVFSS